jgi:hypothetical protein
MKNKDPDRLPMDDRFVILLHKKIMDKTGSDRVAGGCFQPRAPSEPYVTVSRHTAQAFIKACLCGAARLFSYYVNDAEHARCP